MRRPDDTDRAIVASKIHGAPQQNQLGVNHKRRMADPADQPVGGFIDDVPGQ